MSVMRLIGECEGEIRTLIYNVQSRSVMSRDVSIDCTGGPCRPTLQKVF